MPLGLTIRVRRNAFGIFELTAEMAVVFITDLPGNDMYGQVGGFQKMAGQTDADLFDEGKQLNAAFFAEQIAQVGGGEADFLGNAVQRQFFAAVKRDV